MMNQEILETLENKIVLYKHLGIEFQEISSSRIHLVVDLEKNSNHKGTAFGGSLYTAAVVSAYALVLAGLRSRNILTENIVIAKGSMDYKRPVAEDFDVVSEYASPEEEKSFFEDLIKKGTARREINAYINVSGGSLCAGFSGTFVVKL